MPKNRSIPLFILLVLAIVATFAGCTSTGGTQTADSTSAEITESVANISASGQNAAPPGNPPGGAPPGGMPPGGDTGTSSYNLSGVYTVNGGTATKMNGQYTSTATDVSGIYVTNGGNLILNNPIITTSGNTSSDEASSFYGLNGAVLANNGSTVVINGGTISSSGSGANGTIPTGTGTSISLTDVKITATGDGGHGVMATLGGSLQLTNVDIATTGAHGAPIATDRGGGTVTVAGGTVTSTGSDSPGIYSTGNISVTAATITSTGTEAAVIEGSNAISLTDTTLTGGTTKTGGIMIYQSMSGDAGTGIGTLTLNGGSYTATGGPAFFVTNTRAVISLTHVNIATGSDTLIKAAGTDRWGSTGSNGGTVTLDADGEVLTGNLVTDNISSISAVLRNGSNLTGSINMADLNLYSTSTWTVTGDSALASLSDTAGISGTSINNIIGNGHTVTYDRSLAANNALGGKVYSLVNGGQLKPR